MNLTTTLRKRARWGRRREPRRGARRWVGGALLAVATVGVEIAGIDRRSRARRRGMHALTQNHADLWGRGSLDRDLATNYDDDVTVLSPDGARRGHEAVRSALARFAERVPNAAVTVKRVRVADGIGIVEWSAVGTAACVEEGVDTVVIRSGRIVAVTIHYRVHALPH